ncbi:putative bifunctional cbb3-type cytochrome c oxidase subunit II/cytochrome c [Variovorax sp. PBL-H6]|uniref:c-type cytochrome n=1 Tax=Variovorax sp. PBL-H6 TaxID=434009 RepID=UPI0013190294|nr:c-type cytochrome [Variovorax sp. PBL-H6]VTU27077.1 putative bifunctional cbb3-type cytochrome c oxidase subunit II/cytochrome c [Variovorax sp. PBL-H6]
MRTFKTVLLTSAVLGLVAAAGAAAVVYGGLYNVAATSQHIQPVHTVLETAMRQSVRLRARAIEVPRLDDPQLVMRGAACFRAKCQQCHGGPGVAQGDIGKSMQPLPGPLVDARHHWKSRELYWVTKHGIKMSGMPAWEYRLAEEDLWAVVAFLERLPDLTARDYAEQTEGPATCGPGEAVTSGTLGDARRGAQALHQYACNACHSIPGITGSSVHVGPPLDGIARRTMIGGRFANTPDSMVRWLRRTHEVDPRTAMPEMGVTEQDARDIAEFLSTLD